MASLSPPSLHSFNKTKISTLSQRVTCSASNKESTGKIHRRNVLLGLGGLYSLTGTIPTDKSAIGAPMEAPDLSKCSLADSGTHEQTKPIPRKALTARTRSVERGLFDISNVFPIALDGPVNVLVTRPNTKKRSYQEKQDEEEVLLIEEIKFESDQVVKFDVYINDKEYKKTSATNTEFAGSFVNVPHKNRNKNMVTALWLGLTDSLENMDAEGDDQLLVTLVPRAGEGVTIGGIKIVFDS